MTPLTEIEVRVLGALAEKDLTTPEYYPLSLNALVNACNQKSNRHPVTAYPDREVAAALASLRERKLALEVIGSGSRVPKYAHCLGEAFNLGNRESALLCVLMLRGPQTLGELRDRAGRMYAFDDLPAVETCLAGLAGRQPEPLARKLPHQHGWKEPRWSHLLAGEATLVEPEPAAPPPAGAGQRLDLIERELESLRETVAELERQLREFRKQFE